MKAVTLLRVSSEGQTKRAGADEGYSLDVQREGCLGKAAALEAEVAGEFVGPAQSASKGMYPALRQALDFLRDEGNIDYFIVYRLDRLARDELTQFTVLAELKAAGAQLVSVTENIDETPQGMLALGILASVNAYRSRDDARKITEGRVKKAQLGGTPVRAPLGYLNARRWEGANDIRTIEVDRERAPHVQWAFQAYASGEWPLKALTEELHERGLRSRATPKRPAGRVAMSSVQRMLRNPYYIGLVRFRGIDYEGNHPKLITPDLFDQVQQVLTTRAVAGEHQWIHQHYLKGTVFCGRCGRRLKFTKVTGRGGAYDYFVCSARHASSACDLPYLAAPKVELHVALYYLEQVNLDAERVAALEPRLVEMFRLLTAYRYREVERHQRDVDDIRGRRNQLVADHLANPKAIPLDVLEQHQSTLNSKLASAQAELAKSSREIGKAERGLALARQFLHDSAGTYRDAGPETRRRWNQVFFRRLFVGPEGVSGAELGDEFGALLADDLAAKLQSLPSNPKPLRAQGSTFERLVETVGIEPTSAVAC